MSAKDIYPINYRLLLRSDKELMLSQKSRVYWFCGLSGSGKSTLAIQLENDLHNSGTFSVVLDGDNLRNGLNQDLGFSDTDRMENIRRVSEVAKTLVSNGLVVIVSLISPKKEFRDSACHPQSVTMVLEDEIDVSRGDMIVKPNNQPKISQDLDAFICWFSSTKKMVQGGKLIFRHTTKEARAIVSDIRYKVDVNSLRKMEEVDSFEMNDIGRVSLRISQPVFHDTYRRNRNTGSFILVDPFTNETLTAGMLR